MRTLICSGLMMCIIFVGGIASGESPEKCHEFCETMKRITWDSYVAATKGSKPERVKEQMIRKNQNQYKSVVAKCVDSGFELFYMSDTQLLKNKAATIADIKTGCYLTCTSSKDLTGATNYTAIGKPAPNITVMSLKNEPLSLSSLKGKVVLIYFWATWNPTSREEIPFMMKLDSAMTGKPFQILAISTDEGGKPEVAAFLKESDLTFPAYLDTDNLASKLYGITGVPEMFVIDKQGVLVKKVIGPKTWDSPEAISFLEGLMK